jgi:hypothetical protein
MYMYYIFRYLNIVLECGIRSVKFSCTTGSPAYKQDTQTQKQIET